MHTTDIGTTWAGTHTFMASRLYRPCTVAEAAAVIGSVDRVRVVGTRHSFNDIADGEVMISLGDIEPEFHLDTDEGTISVNGGTRYGDLAFWLEARGFALRNMGSLPHISIAGANATGTHGSGDAHGILATAIRGIELITAHGEMVRFDSAHPDFLGMMPSLGALGVVTRLTLEVEPSYQVRQDVYAELDWATALSELETIMASGYSVSLFTSWEETAIAQVLVKTRCSEEATVPEEIFGARRIRPGGPECSALGENLTVQGGVSGPWLERIPHFRLDATPSNGDEIQSEYFVDRSDGPAALKALRELRDVISPYLIGSEIRSVAADERWLSPAYQRDSLAIHFTWRNEPHAVNSLLPRIEAALAPFGARPHWGKTFCMQAERIRSLYPRLGDFAELAEQMDPAGKFRNDYTRRVLGIGHVKG